MIADLVGKGGHVRTVPYSRMGQGEHRGLDRCGRPCPWVSIQTTERYLGPQTEAQMRCERHHGLGARAHSVNNAAEGRAMDIVRPLATSQDQSVQPRYAATWRGVMQVGLLRSHGRLLRPISACDRMKLQTFFDAAHLLICCDPRWAGLDMPVGLLIVRRSSISW